MRFAVVFKAYAWDPFVERQARRCRAASGSGDFFVALDETAGPLGEIPFAGVFRFSCDDLVALGFQPRFEEGSLLWWNPDYAHYAFNEAYPDYDVYVFVEYDALINGCYEDLVVEAIEAGADLVALPIKVPTARWRWTLPHRQTYASDVLVSTLVCISLFQRHALETLARRRREMAGSATLVPFWPSAEVFVPTEARRAGLVALSLSQFGDVSRYDAFPPMLERDLPASSGTPAFFHPVLDPDRYVASILRSSRAVDFLRGSFHRSLAKAVRRPSTAAVIRAALYRLVEATRIRRQLVAIRLFGRLAEAPSRRSRTIRAPWLSRPHVPGEEIGS